MIGRIKLIAIAVLAVLLLGGGWLWYWYPHGGRAACLAKSARAEDRLRAAKMLENINNALSRRTLATLAADADMAVAVNAVRSLSADEGAEATGVLLGLARQAERGVVRGEAAIGLATRPEMPAAELIEMLRSDADQAARSATAEALGRRGDPTALPALADALNDKSIGVRVLAFGALKKMVELKSDYSPADEPSPRRQAAIEAIRAQLQP